MPVLSRKVGEVVHIGDDIEVRILQISTSVVRLGITVPRNMPVVRPKASKHEPTATAGVDKKSIGSCRSLARASHQHQHPANAK